MFPIEAARWALSLEVIRVRRTGEKFEKKDLRRVRALVRELSGCTPAMARTMVADVAVKETFSKALMARFPTKEDSNLPGKVPPKKHVKRAKKKKGSKKKVLKR
jgi:hypothetical protein